METTGNSGWRWSRVIRQLLFRTRLALIMSSISSGRMASSNPALTQTAYAAQTVRRRAQWVKLEGISKLSKEKLFLKAAEVGMETTGLEKREELLNNLFNFVPEGVDVEAGGARRRPRDPNMPGLARMTKAQLIQVGVEKGIFLEPRLTTEQMKARLYQAPPQQPVAAYQSRHATASSSSTGPKAKARPNAKAFGARCKAKAKAKAENRPPPEQHDIYETAETPQEEAPETFTLIEEEATEAHVIEEEAEDPVMVEALDQQARELANLWTPEERARMMRALRAHRD